MNWRCWLTVVMACGAAVMGCGAPKPGPQPGTTYFWNVTSSTLDWGALCSDNTQFRMNVTPLAFDTNSYLIYKVSTDGQKATLQSCDRVDPATCTDSTPVMVLDVAGTELSFSDQQKTATSVGTCNVLDTQQWTLEDKVQTLDVLISDTLSLVDDPPSCDTLEADARANAPNGLGYQGCVVNYHLSGTLKLPFR